MQGVGDGRWPYLSASSSSSGMLKVRKRLWKRASAVSMAVGKPQRGIILQALKNLLNATSMQV